MRVICFSHPERDCDGERDGAVVLWSDDVTLPPPHVHPPPSPLRTPPLGRYYDNITMAAEEDELVSRYAHDLVTRVLKTSMKQLEGSVQWPSSATFTTAVGRDTIEQLVSVTSLSGRRALFVYKPTRLVTQSWQLDKSWRYSLDYLGLKDELHCYRLLWSRPTRRNPVPRVAAAVYIFILMTEEVNFL